MSVRSFGPARAASVAVAVAACLAACGGDGTTGRDSIVAAGSGSPTTEPEPAASVPGAPPPVRVVSGDRSLDLEPWTYCFGNGCADGMPPTEPPDIGTAEQVVVEYPLEGWSFTASFQPAGDECGPVQDVPVTLLGDGTHVLSPAGHAGVYDVTLFGQGNGDLFVTFRWTTPRDGPLPIPKARLAVLADHDGRVDSYGVELELTHLAATPTDASALITVRDAGGSALTFAATRADIDCLHEGSVYWDGPDEQGVAAAALGAGPFTYDVVVTLDGSRYTATASWPDDVIVGNEPSVALDFEPHLPAPA